MVAFYAFSSDMLGLCIGAAFSGLSKSLFNGNNNALLYESLKANNQEDQFHHCQGRAGSMFQLGLGLSALAASLFTSRGLQFVFIAGIFPQILATIVSLMFEEPKVHVPTSGKTLLNLKIAFANIRKNLTVAIAYTGTIY